MGYASLYLLCFSPQKIKKYQSSLSELKSLTLKKKALCLMFCVFLNYCIKFSKIKVNFSCSSHGTSKDTQKNNYMAFKQAYTYMSLRNKPVTWELINCTPIKAEPAIEVLLA